jgi:hypothetical protein
MTKPKKTKWHAFDDERAKALMAAQQPNVVYFPSPCNPAPSGPLSMPGIASWMGSNVSVPIVSSNGLTIGTEIAVLCTSGTMTKAYQYMVGTSSDGSLHFAGPYKDFPAHHVHPGQQVAPADYFGNTPVSKSKTA